MIPFAIMVKNHICLMIIIQNGKPHWINKLQLPYLRIPVIED